MRTKINRTPKAWQTDPSNITTDRVQFWSNGVIVTAQMSKTAAQEAVSEGRAFVITEQAIGAIVNDQMFS